MVDKYLCMQHLQSSNIISETLTPSSSNAHTVVMQSCEWSRSQQCGMNPPFGDSLQSLTVILRMSGLHHVRVAGISSTQVRLYGRPSHSCGHPPTVLYIL